MDLRPKGPIFGLTLKGMLVITALLAVGMAFVGTKVKRARDEDAIAREIVRLGGSVRRQYFGMDVSTLDMDRTWFEQLIGLDLEAHVSSVALHGDKITDALVARLAGLEELQSVELSDTNIDVTAVAALARLPSLARVRLLRTGITDDGLAALATLPNVEQLDIDNNHARGFGGEVVYPPMSDAGLAEVSRMATLKHLRLSGLQFTNASLRQLQGLSRLEYLSISGARVSDDGLAALAQAVPHLRDLSIAQCPITGTGLAELTQVRQ